MSLTDLGSVYVFVYGFSFNLKSRAERMVHTEKHLFSLELRQMRKKCGLSLGWREITVKQTRYKKNTQKGTKKGSPERKC